MMVFADAFYWLALASEDDAAHQRAAQFASSFSGATITTEWVLAEVYDGLASVRSRHLVLGLRRIWRNHPRLRIVEGSHGLFERGMDLFCGRQDKGWSLTDCISFEVMQEHGVTEALTGDHHFEQAGFTALLA